MRVNGINMNQSFKAQLSPRVEEGFRKLGNGIVSQYGKDSDEMKKYLQGIYNIKRTCPDATIDIEDYYDTYKRSGSLYAPGIESVNHYNAYVLKTKYLPDDVIKKVENKKDLFTLKTLEDIAYKVYGGRAGLLNNVSGKLQYLPDREAQTDKLKSINESMSEIINNKTLKKEYMYAYKEEDYERLKKLEALF